MKKKILVRGPVLSRSGYGEQTRFAIRSLRAYEDIYDIFIMPTNWGKTGWVWEENEERQWVDEKIKQTALHTNQGGQFDMSLQVTIPNEWEKLAPINIGYTAGIETTKVAPQWVEKSYLMDRIVVVSNHAKQIYETTTYQATDKSTGQTIDDFRCQTPIEVVNYPVRDIGKPDGLDLELETDFNFLVSSQWGPRKNIDNTIKWFIEEFHDQDVGLVAKLNWHNDSINDRMGTERRLKQILSQYGDRKCKVYLLHGSLTDQEMANLYAHPKIKAYISLTHGEGYGLPLFEAAYHGLPIIAPDWSGHLDFLYMPVKDKKTKKTNNKAMFTKVDYQLGPIPQEAVWDGVLQADSMWCYANQGSYKMKLREMKSKYKYKKTQAKKLQEWILENFEQSKMYKRMAEAINGEEIITIDAKDLPKISILTSVYDGDEFIRPFLEDITRQTIFEEKCELVLVNANTPGNEEEVIKEYLEKYPNNIIYEKLDEDPGIYGTWNKAIELSSGEYVTNANLDDRKAPNSIEAHAKALFTNQDVDLVYADSFITNSPNETFEENTSQGRRYNFEQFSKEAMLRGNQPHNNPMWRKSLHDKNGLFESDYKSAGDWEFFLRCAFAGSKYKKLDQPLGLYFFNPKGISTNFENFEWKQKEEQEIHQKYKKLAANE
tara:strand:+ start:1166 stop:3142 length:1977 start_codon:yes stop_codon:yes gene_type:complete